MFEKDKGLKCLAWKVFEFQLRVWFKTKKLNPPKIIIQTYFGSKFFLLTKNNFDSKNFQTQFFFDPKRSSFVFWYKPTKPKSFEPKTYQAEHFRPKSCSDLISCYNEQNLINRNDVGNQVLASQLYHCLRAHYLTLWLFGTGVGEIITISITTTATHAPLGE